MDLKYDVAKYLCSLHRHTQKMLFQIELNNYFVFNLIIYLLRTVVLLEIDFEWRFFALNNGVS